MKSRADMPPDTPSFFSRLPAVFSFSEVANLSNYRPLPSSWVVIVSDLKNSTSAVKQGKYKEVNMIGASVITAVKNVLDSSYPFPYLFDGDGAVICLPGRLLEKVKPALATARNSAKVAFGQELRIGIMPVQDIRKAGYEVLIGKHEVSSNYQQASFMGGGIDYAHEAIKKQDKYRLTGQISQKKDLFQGLECRWDHVQKPGREVLSVLIRAADNKESSEIYRQVVAKMGDIYGKLDEQNPITQNDLTLTPDVRKLRVEALLKNCFSNLYTTCLYWINVYFEFLTGKILMAMNIKNTPTNWSRYKMDLAANSDYQKFGDMIKQIVSGTPEQNRRFESYLEKQYQKGTIVYGIHRSPAAMITCMVTSRNGDHIHFVDGSGGGYTMAAEDRNAGNPDF